MKKIVALSGAFALLFVSTGILETLVVHADEESVPAYTAPANAALLTWEKNEREQYVTTFDKDYEGVVRVVGDDNTIINQYVNIVTMDGDDVVTDVTLEPKDQSLTAEIDISVKAGNQLIVSVVRTMIPAGVSVPYTLTFTDFSGADIVEPLKSSIEHEEPSTDHLIDMTVSYGFSSDGKTFHIADTSKNKDDKDADMIVTGDPSDGEVIFQVSENGVDRTFSVDADNNYETTVPVKLSKSHTIDIKIIRGDAENTKAKLVSTLALKNPIAKDMVIAKDINAPVLGRAVMTTYHRDIDTNKDLAVVSMTYDIGSTIGARAGKFFGYELIGSHQQDITIIDGTNEAVFYYKKTNTPVTPQPDKPSTDSSDQKTPPTNNNNTNTPTTDSSDNKPTNKKQDTSFVPQRDNDTKDSTSDSQSTSDSKKQTTADKKSDEILPQAGTDMNLSDLLTLLGATGVTFSAALFAYIKRRLHN